MLYAVQLSSCKCRAVPRDIGVAALVAVGQPLPDVARHVVAAEGFRLVPSDRQIERPVIGRDAGVAGQQRECPFRTANASNSTIIPRPSFRTPAKAPRRCVPSRPAATGPVSGRRPYPGQVGRILEGWLPRPTLVSRNAIHGACKMSAPCDRHHTGTKEI